MTRHIDFEGVENFRDFGGYATACGRGLRRGLLFRSASHARATDQDLENMAGLGIAVVVDLRRDTERRREPSRRWRGFAARVIESDLDSRMTDWSEALRGSDLSADWFHGYALDYYDKAPFEPRHLDLYSRYFQALAAAEGPVLVHCAAGKDRTGIICALTHHIAGVGRDDLVEDYLLTNDEARIARRIALVGPAIEAMIGRRPSDEAMRTALGVQPVYLETAFAAMEARHGSLDGYLAEALGVDADLRERVAARILA